jgi:hypothetical protein
MGFAAKVIEVQTMLLSPRSGGLTLARPFKAGWERMVNVRRVATREFGLNRR